MTRACVALCALMVFVACAPRSSSESVAITAGPAQGAAGTPDVEIVRPVNGATMLAGDIKVSVRIDGFKLVKADDDGTTKPGRGHIHYYLDAGQIPTEPGVPATGGEGRYHVSTKKSYTWDDVEPGTHTFAVQLVNVDHTPLEPPITSETTVTLASGDEVTEMEKR